VQILSFKPLGKDRAPLPAVFRCLDPPCLSSRSRSLSLAAGWRLESIDAKNISGVWATLVQVGNENKESALHSYTWRGGCNNPTFTPAKFSVQLGRQQCGHDNSYCIFFGIGLVNNFEKNDANLCYLRTNWWLVEPRVEIPDMCSRRQHQVHIGIHSFLGTHRAPTGFRIFRFLISSTT